MRIRRRTDRRASLTRRAGFVLLVGLLTAIAPVLHPEPVSAASGVDDYPTRLKYAPQDSLVDPWQFYNRECTSFVAWRLNSENQVAFDDYWQGQHWGNASHWKAAAVALGIPVDNRPTRGAVAWWAAGSAGSSRGHVAWVQTVGDGAITIEEYNYLSRGRYDTRTISSSSSLWPSGFIHIKDTQIRNTVAPTVTGTPQVGVRLRATRGTWSATNLDYSFQWLANGAAIKGATSKSFTPTAGQLGDNIRVKVTASKSGAHSGTAKSSSTGSVAKGVFVSSTQPVVSGTAQVGLQLSGTSGTIKPATQLRYQWIADGKPVTGATGTTFTPSADQLDAVLKLKVIASAPGYKTLRVRSDPTDAVEPGQFESSAPPVVSGVAQVDKPLTASPGSWSPAGQVSYQWLADGTPIRSATTSSYTPRPGDLRKQIAVQVTVRQRGYADAVSTSAPTAGVAPGTFLNTAAPRITGTAQVGVPLTASPGSWTPRATIAYQWLVDGNEVPGATGRTFTPRPEDLGKPVDVEVLASRPGYLTAVVPATPTASVRPGVIHNHQVPVLSGKPVVGHALHTTDGTWSITPDSFSYQWYAGSTPIAGATGATYHPTAADAGQRLHVVVTAASAGYTPAPAGSTSTAPVVFGTVGFEKPTVRGHAVVGRTLTAHVTGVNPTTATPHFQWYRGREPIRGAQEATYVVQPEDLGHRIHVVVTMTADNWTSRTKRSVSVTDIRTTPRLHPHVSMREGRLFLRLVVRSPGLTTSSGLAKVWRGHERVGRFDVVDGRGSRLLAPLRPGTHTLVVVYHGGPRETVARTTVTVTVP